MGHSTKTSTFDMSQCLKITFFFKSLKLYYIITVLIGYKNIPKVHLNGFLPFLYNYFKISYTIYLSLVLPDLIWNKINFY